MYEFKQSDAFDISNFLGSDAKKKGNELFFKFCPYCNPTQDKFTFSINLISGAFSCFRSSCGAKGHFVELARDFNFSIEQPSHFKKLPQRKISSSPSAIKYLQTRKISSEVIEKYNITTRKDNEKILVFPFYDQQNTLRFIKYRNTNKNFKGSKEWCEKNTQPILFGMNHCVDFSHLVITEGQIDSLSLSSCNIKNAVSVPTGALGFTWFEYCKEWLKNFEKIIIFGDCENGKITLVDKLNSLLHSKIFVVRFQDYLMEKDANDILVKFGPEAIQKAVQNAQIQEIKSVKRLSQVKHVDLMNLPKIETGFYLLDDIIGGFYLGQVILLSGKRGEGKSTFMSQLVANALKQNFNCFIYSGELPDYHFKNWLDLQIAGIEHIQHMGNKHFISELDANKINLWYHDKAFIFDNDFVQENELVDLINIIEQTIFKYDIKLVCVDNLMSAIDDDSSCDFYRQQAKFVKSLKKIAQKYNIAIILIAHPNKSKGKFENDAVSGSGDITNAVDLVLCYQRSESNDFDSDLLVTKNRLTGNLATEPGTVKLIYDNVSKRIFCPGTLENKVFPCFEDISELDLPFE